MKHLISLMLILAIMTGQYSCTRPEAVPDEAQIRKGIEEAVQRCSDAVKRGDLEGTIAMFSDDATLVPPNGDLIQGKEGVRKHYDFLFKAGLRELTMTSIEVGALGEMAYEIGKTRFVLQPEGQDARVDSTKYLMIWKRQPDNTWKVVKDIWNFRSPAIDTLHTQVEAAE